MFLVEWQALLDASNLIDDLFTERNVKVTFACAMQTSKDELTDNLSHRQMRFVEFITGLAMVVVDWKKASPVFADRPFADVLDWVLNKVCTSRKGKSRRKQEASVAAPDKASKTLKGTAKGVASLIRMEAGNGEAPSAVDSIEEALKQQKRITRAYTGGGSRDSMKMKMAIAVKMKAAGGGAMTTLDGSDDDDESYDDDSSVPESSRGGAATPADDHPAGMVHEAIVGVERAPAAGEVVTVEEDVPEILEEFEPRLATPVAVVEEEIGATPLTHEADDARTAAARLLRGGHDFVKGISRRKEEDSRAAESVDL